MFNNVNNVSKRGFERIVRNYNEAKEQKNKVLAVYLLGVLNQMDPNFAVKVN